MLRLDVHLLPQLVAAEALADSITVVLDILRASTTITTALVNGAQCVVPCLTIEAARQYSEKLPRECYLLGGERGGLLIPGFDHGNTPTEYVEQKVSGRTIIFTTTNGTAAMQHASQSAEILIGSFVNLSALSEYLKHAGATRNIQLICAGTSGVITLEDVLCAGAIIEQLDIEQIDPAAWNDSARLALAAWRQTMGRTAKVTDNILADDRIRLQRILQDTQGGRNLAALGLGDDLLAAAAINAIPAIPFLDTSCWKIRLKTALSG